MPGDQEEADEAGALSQRRPVGIALQHGLHDLRESRPGVLDGGADGLIGPRGGELRVVGGQLFDATF